MYFEDISTVKWFVEEINLTDGSADFSFQIPAGGYLIYGFTEDGGWAGYTALGSELSIVEFVPGQEIKGINLQNLSTVGCGPNFSIPASPDGNYQGITGADPECLRLAALEMQ